MGDLVHLDHDGAEEIAVRLVQRDDTDEVAVAITVDGEVRYVLRPEAARQLGCDLIVAAAQVVDEQ